MTVERVRRVRFVARLLASPDWMTEALCALYDPDWWYPMRGVSDKQAKEICAACPVQMSCLEYAVRHREPHGIWGGLSEEARRGMSV